MVFGTKNRLYFFTKHLPILSRIFFFVINNAQNTFAYTQYTVLFEITTLVIILKYDNEWSGTSKNNFVYPKIAGQVRSALFNEVSLLVIAVKVDAIQTF